MSNKTEYSLPQLTYLAHTVEDCKPPSLTSVEQKRLVDFNSDFSPSLSYFQGDFFMAISYKVDGQDEHQRIPLDAIQVANLVSQGAKSLAAHVNYDMKRGVGK